MTTIVRKMLLNGGHTLRPKVEHVVEIEIDDERLVRYLGEKSFCNKSKRSKAIAGMIKAHVYPTTGEKR